MLAIVKSLLVYLLLYF